MFSQIAPPPSYLVAIAVGSVVVIGYALLEWSCFKGEKGTNVKLSQKRKKKRKKLVVTPPWAIKKAEYLKPPEMSREAKEKRDRRRPPDEWNTVIIFPDLMPDRPDAPTKQLKKYFRAAKVSMYLCVYLCSLFEMSDLIADKYREGLVILIITDYDTWTAHNNKGLKILAKKGIQLRLNMNGYLMHNKFSIIDDEAVLTGSLNWTKQGARTNNENVLVTTDPRITTKYIEEFNKLWSGCKNWDDL